MSTTRDEALVALLLTCTSLAHSAAASAGSTPIVSRDLQIQLLDLHQVLKRIDISEAQETIISILRDCKEVLQSLQDCLQQYDSVQPVPDTDKYSPQDEKKEWAVQQRHAILRCRNALSLALAFKGSFDELNSEHRFQDLMQDLTTKFKRFSEEIVVDADNIFAPSPESTVQETFIVQERDVSDDKIQDPERDITICPNAVLLHKAGVRAKSRILKLGCCLIDKHSFLVEKLRPGRNRTWEIFLVKPETKSFVVVTVSGPSPLSVRRIQDLSKSLYLRTRKKNIVLGESTSPHILLSSTSLLLLDSMSISTFAMSNKPRIQVQTTEGSSRLDCSARFIGLFHYVVATGETLKHLEGSRAGKPRLQSHARLVIGQQPLTGLHFNVDDVFTLFIYKDVIIQHQSDRPLWVKLSGTELLYNQVQVECSVDIQFGSPTDAAHFVEQLRTMTERLLQTFVQEPFSNEIEIYVEDSEALTMGSDDRSRTDISVILSRAERFHKQRLRLIARRRGSTGVLCLDFGMEALRAAKQSLHDLQDLINFRFLDHDISGKPTLMQSNWHKVRTQVGSSRMSSQENRLGGAQVISNRSFTSEDWLDDIGDLSTALKSPLITKGDHKLVKVCVIDTGFCAKDKDSKKVKGFKDFVDPENTQLRDETWHGTQTASIILSIYDSCELYVARVFETDNVDENIGSKLVAQAIEWAIEPSQDVDIINISAGFKNHCPDLQAAVQKASGANKLVFAAAGNWANVERVAYPARHTLYTMCIFSTTVRSQNSQYNPEVLPFSHNFALLGEDWQHRGKAGERMNGTSMATAAASGLAALILDFSRQPDNQTIMRVGDIGNLLGMTAIFLRMAKPAGNLKCVDPKRLLPIGWKNMSEAVVRAEVRSRISAAMEEAN